MLQQQQPTSRCSLQQILGCSRSAGLDSCSPKRCTQLNRSAPAERCGKEQCDRAAMGVVASRLVASCDAGESCIVLEKEPPRRRELLPCWRRNLLVGESCYRAGEGTSSVPLLVVLSAPLSSSLQTATERDVTPAPVERRARPPRAVTPQSGTAIQRHLTGACHRKKRREPLPTKPRSRYQSQDIALVPTVTNMNHCNP
uniref:Uncharacterized protein n=1 Tax=Oryza barthii TaxID=65489 RepID=A0A0D3FXG6_9ORYZ